jgi:predicted RNA binding protein YcfA (HicA-like mRNA interferase family)
VKIPRDLSGVALAKALSRIGYQVTRQSGSHIRLTIQTPVQHHITVPAHDPLKVGTLSGILGDVAAHLKITRDELLEKLFG